MVKQKIWWVCFVLLALVLPSIVPVVQAGADDVDTKERGVEWVKDYSGNPDGWGNLANTKDDAESFYNALGNLGWRRVFDYGDSLAWESDFEKSSVGGSDATYIDGLDFAYFSGHGTPMVSYSERIMTVMEARPIEYISQRLTGATLIWNGLCSVLARCYNMMIQQETYLTAGVTRFSRDFT